MQVDCHTFYTEYATFMQIQPIKQKNVPEAAKATALLQCLSEHLVFANVVVTDGAASESHCLFKVVLPDLWHRIILFHLLQKWYEVPSCKASKAAAEQKRVNVKTWIKKRDRRSTDHGWWVGLPLPLPADLILNALPDGQLTCPLADLCKICSREAIGHLCQEVQVHILTKKKNNNNYKIR